MIFSGEFTCMYLKWLLLFMRVNFCDERRYSFTKALCIAFVMTFFSMFDVPVFWPILLCYWVVLFVLTMRRQVAHMMKYKYIPFNLGKQVCFLMLKLSFYHLFCATVISLYLVSSTSKICFVFVSFLPEI